MCGHDIIIVGSSAGGLGALPRWIAGLPANRAALLCRLGEREYHSESVGKNSGNMAKELERKAPLIRNLLQTDERD
jgi:hypothetical protein